MIAARWANAVAGTTPLSWPDSVAIGAQAWIDAAVRKTAVSG